MLPIQDNKLTISNSIDIINQEIQNNEYSNKLFKCKTNLPKKIQLQIGAKIMFLNNSEFQYGICNGTIGIITDLNMEAQTVRCAFCIEIKIIDIEIKKHTSSFLLHGAPASRTQYPIINAHALTVHKVQGLTLPNVSLNLDSQMFEKGQA